MKCPSKGCENEATVAIRVRNPEISHHINSTIWYDERDAPKVASRYCWECGLTVMSSLARTLR